MLNATDLKPGNTGAEDILIFAPTGQDAQLLANVLQKDGFNCQIFVKMFDIAQRLQQDAGVLVFAEEALHVSAIIELNRVLAEQEPWSDIPIIVMTTGGETTFASLRVLKDFTPAGNVTLLERPFRPITLLSTIQVALRSRRRQFQVRTLLEKQKEATRVRDEFISIASHELKTPLTSLKMQTQLNQRFIGKVPAPESALTLERFQKYIRTSDQQVSRLTRLIEDMLDVSRINAGKLLLAKTKVDFSALIEELVDRINPQIQAAGGLLSLQVENGIKGNWDRYRVEQVITNLLTNAIRYASGKPIHLTAARERENLVLSVRDEGAGIAPENHEKIFDRFERAPSSRNIDGLGLGLYICRQIVSAHGGTIGVKSALGAGATFTVTLPLDHE